MKTFCSKDGQHHSERRVQIPGYQGHSPLKIQNERHSLVLRPGENREETCRLRVEGVLSDFVSYTVAIL